MIADKSILLVEDDPIEVKRIQRSLKRKNSAKSLQIVENGLAAIEFLQACLQFNLRHATPSVVLLNLKMPMTESFSLVQWIKARSELGHISVRGLASSEELTNAFSTKARRRSS